jgi:hypothetical protein
MERRRTHKSKATREPKEARFFALLVVLARAHAVVESRRVLEWLEVALLAAEDRVAVVDMEDAARCPCRRLLFVAQLWLWVKLRKIVGKEAPTTLAKPARATSATLVLIFRFCE